MSPTSEGKVQELTDGYWEAHGFPECIGAIDRTHIEIAELSEHYSDFINRKGYFSLNVQAVYDYKCYLWSGSVPDARIFLNSSIKGMHRNRIIPPCENIIRRKRSFTCILVGWPSVSSSSIFNERIFWRWKKWKGKFFS